MKKEDQNLMETIKLSTSTGEFVANVQIPKFTPPADVVLWGARFFIRSDEGYREAFTYAVPEGLVDLAEQKFQMSDFGLSEDDNKEDEK